MRQPGPEGPGLRATFCGQLCAPTGNGGRVFCSDSRCGQAFHRYVRAILKWNQLTPLPLFVRNGRIGSADT
jgi:hypothetical protein